jgi:hypothetical protein
MVMKEGESHSHRSGISRIEAGKEALGTALDNLLLFTALPFFLLASLLGGLLLLLLVFTFRSSILSQGLLQDLQDFLVGDFLVRLEDGEIRFRRCSQSRQPILCNCCESIVSICASSCSSNPEQLYKQASRQGKEGKAN